MWLTLNSNEFTIEKSAWYKMQSIQYLQYYLSKSLQPLNNHVVTKEVNFSSK